MNTGITISKKELAQKLGYVFPSERIDYIKLEKKILETGVLNKLKMSIEDYRKRHKERFDVKQTSIILKTLNLS